MNLAEENTLPDTPAGKKRLFVLDTNVLMHDPTAIFRFEEHDIFIPMVVLEELDKAKKGMSEVSRNVRQVSRFLDEIMGGASKDVIRKGLPLPAPGNGKNGDEARERGKLYFETKPVKATRPEHLPGNTPDNSILISALGLMEGEEEKGEEERRLVTLVSKDINLRIKAAVLGIPAEDYENDKVLDDMNLLYSGVAELPKNFWDTHERNMESWTEEGRTFYRVSGPDIEEWYPNQCLHIGNGEDSLEATVVHTDDTTVIELAKDYRNPKQTVWGITARNEGQNFALNMLLNPEVDFVSLLGIAGTGKTLLALAAGLVQTLDLNLYREIIMTRVTVPVGEDIGFLPGTEEEKMTPWMGALMDNLEVLTQTEGGEWGRGTTEDLLRSRIRIHSLNFMRGRTFLNKYIILDEAQNLTPKQMKTLITRAGPGTKIVCLGNVAQIDTPYLTETTSGLTYAVDRFKDWGRSGHITLIRGERSPLADFASEKL